MDDQRAPDEIAPAGDALGPLVPPDLLPGVEQPAFRPPAPLWQSVSVALLVLALLGAIASGVVWANDRWGDAAQLTTAAEGFKRLVSGEADAFLALVQADARPAVKRADILANERLGRSLEWDPPRIGDGAIGLTVRLTSARAAAGTATFTPDPQRGDLVLVATSGGPLGDASGTIQLARTFDGWRITGYRFEGFVEPTGTPRP